MAFPDASPYDQSGFAVRFEWGEQGLAALGQGGGVFVLVDVLSFCPCVDIAVSRGAQILPFPYRDDRAADHAREQNALLASCDRRHDRYSLSPTSLTRLPTGARLVLPSPNGATLSLQATELGVTVAACLRNARAAADFARSRPGPVNVIACGERWPGGALRPCWEDLVGAGAVISHLPGSCSPEAEAAVAAFRAAEGRLFDRLQACASGRELIERGFAADVELAGGLDISTNVPVLCGRAFIGTSEQTGF